MAAVEQVTGPTNRLHAANLTRGSLLARNTVWNLVGQILPMAAGLFAIPRLIHGLGTDRFGALTIAWMVVGYFSFFDLGLGRAMTNLVAQKLATDSEHELPGIIWTANLLMGALGVVGGIMLMILSPVLVQNLKTPATLQPETTKAFYVLAISVPFVISTAGFRGILEARQRFKIVNIVRCPMGIATFAAPLVVLPWSANLIPVVEVLVFVRFVFWVAYVWLALRDMPILRRNISIQSRMIPKLFSFGAWMTVSNIISPVMAYMDRFLVGMLLSLAAVAYYATPFEVITKLLIVPGAVVGVLFPAFSTALVGDSSRAGLLFRRGTKYLIILLFPIVLFILVFAQQGMSLWLGREFAGHSTRVLQWLAIGVFVNCLANLPFALIQAAGRPDITAKFHILELPFYLVTVWALTKQFGIEGTAIAWLVRVCADAILLFWFSDRLLRGTLPLGSVAAGTAVFVAAFAFAMIPMGVLGTIGFYLAVTGSFVAIAWFVLLVDERKSLA